MKAPPGVLAIRQELIENMCGMLEAVGPLDAWRLQLVRMMCCAGLQATAGVFYVAVLVASLVGDFLAHREDD